MGQSNNFRARTNGHNSGFRLYAACKINKMDNKLVHYYLISHSIDYFHVGNNTESQLEELLGRKERKWIWELGSITPYGPCLDDEVYCQDESCRNR